jgi:hypothetical protein
MAPWIGAGTGRQVDGIHLNAAGEAIIANRMLPINAGVLLGSSYTLSGPASGTQGTASTPFTLSLRGGTSFVADADGTARQSITLNDGGAGGTFASSLGSGASPLTLTPTTGAGFTFTYTPASNGPKSITATSNQPGWKEPVGVIYTVSSGSGGGGHTTTTIPIQVGLPTVGTPYNSITINGTLVIIQ